MIYKTLSLTSDWDKRFLEAAKTVASWSPDPSSQVGAITVSEQNLPLSWGWNAFPRKFPMNEWQVSRTEKYKHVVHAEMNAIYNANRGLVCLRNSTFYIYGIPPCYECAKGIVQVGAKRVISMIYNEVNQKWLDDYNYSLKLFTNAEILSESYYIPSWEKEKLKQL